LSSLPHSTLQLLFLILPPPPKSTLFPYTTLFRSVQALRGPGGSSVSGGPKAGILSSHPQSRIGGCPPAARPIFRVARDGKGTAGDRKSTRLNSSHLGISYAVFCLKKKKTKHDNAC